MAQNLYVTGAEHESGKSVIVLAIMELLSGRSDKAGLFRPVVRTTPEQDMLLNLVTKRYQPDLPLEAMYGCTLDTARKTWRRWPICRTHKDHTPQIQGSG